MKINSKTVGRSSLPGAGIKAERISTATFPKILCIKTIPDIFGC
jgi:hypothetical protein